MDGGARTAAAVLRRTGGQDARVRRRDEPCPTRGPVVYSCPMHPDVVSDEPGSCPKCGMKLLATAVTEYVCPMHPEVVSTTGDDRCPKCGMKLVAAALVASAAEHGHGAHRAPGHDQGGHDSHGDEPAPGHEHGHGSEDHTHHHGH